MDRMRSYIKKIERDHGRFREIVRGRIRKDLRKYMSSGEMVGRQGKYGISIPVPQLRLPTFRFGTGDGRGVGQGDGAEGASVQGGDQPGRHLLEVDVSLDELALIMGEELELPRIQPKRRDSFLTERDRYTGISRAGPESLRHFKRTFREALKRSVAGGTYDPLRPMIVPIKEDRRYRTWKVKETPQNAAVIVYMMDVSGSMGDEQKEIVRLESFWIDTWLRSQYKKLEARYIVHDAAAKEVDRDTFYHLKESGGTKISSAYELCAELVRRDYDPAEWNVDPFHFSDGDNWGNEDTGLCMDLLERTLLPRVNVFCYGQVRSPYGSGQFKKDLDGRFKGNPQVLSSEILGKEGIPDSIKTFLGKGR
jgi:uncharacterized sporulation protein YeaH/YhbH (DUF444 family)